MALQISIETDSGAVASYWRVTGGSVDYTTQTLAVYLAGYVDQAARESGKTPLQTTTLFFGGAATVIGQDPNFIPEPTRTAVYDAIKALPEWAAAKDV